MKQNNKIYKLEINANFDETLKNFEKNVLSENEEIVSTSVADIGDSSHPQKILIVVTKEVHNSHRNLLLEEQSNQLRQQHDSFCPVPSNEERPASEKRYGVYCTCAKKPLLTDELKKELRSVLATRTLLKTPFVKKGNK